VNDAEFVQRALDRIAREREAMQRANERADRREPWVRAVSVIAAGIAAGCAGYLIGPWLAGACR
jgi:ferric-dicitrate binding protein FerR (iron transport regulator)